MKKVMLIIAICFASICGYAQKELFSQYSKQEGVSHVYISSAMMGFIGGMDKNVKGVSKVAKKLDYLQILECERPSLVGQIKSKAMAYYKKNNYEVVMEMNEKDEQVIIYCKKHPKGKNEFSVLSIDKTELSIINLIGTVALSDIEGLIGN